MPDTFPTHRCTDCGYPLEALPAEGDCPECGRTVSASMPSARAGSAWQRGRWVAGVIEPLRRGRAVFEDVRPERALWSFVLLVVSCTIAPVLTAASLFLGGPYTGRAGTDYALSFWFFAALGLVTLSLMEAAGLTFISWRRGWARTRAHQLAVVAHASPGWIVGGVACAVAWQVVQRVPVLWETGRVVYQGQEVLPRGSWVGLVMIASAGIGLMCFEVLAYRGMVRLRFTSAGDG